MHRIELFGEDLTHQLVIGILVDRMAQERGLEVDLNWYSAAGGYGKVKEEYKEFLQDLEKQRVVAPDLMVVVTDSNCQGINERIKGFKAADPSVEVVFAIPDPHIERWLLLDGEAFKAVLDMGCDAPDQKCDSDRYKQLLDEAIAKTGADELFGGELADKIARHIDITRAARADKSFKRFVDQLDAVFTRWQQL